MTNIEKLKAEFRNRAASDPEYYFNPKWRKLLDLYADMAFAVGFEEGLHNRTTKKKPVIMFLGDFEKYFFSKKAASEIMKAPDANITRAIKTGIKCKGYYWRYA